MAITAHWITKEDWTNVLVLKAALIAFQHTPGTHSGDNLGASIVGLLDRANVTKKVSIYLFNVTCADFI
jgi:hypothetical protein